MRLVTAALLLLLLLSIPTTAQAFTVISSNLYHSGTRGFNVRTRTEPLGFGVSFPGIVNFFRAEIPSGYGVIGTQEVDSGTNRVVGIHIPRAIAQSMGRGWAHRYLNLEPASNNIGTHGNAMTTNAKIVKVQEWRFPHAPNNTAQYGVHPRGAIATKLDFGGKRLWFVNLHLDPPNPIAIRQAWQVMGRIKTFDPDFPVIVVGDFNIRNRAPGQGSPEKTYYTLATIFSSASGFVDVSLHEATSIVAPTSRLDGQLDYVFVYDPNQRIRLIDCQAKYVASGSNVFTDHRALVTRFQWN